jgi:Spy/CpxP family protein refolding chaperone
MSIRSRVITLVAASVLVAAALTTVSAQDQGPGRRGMGPGPGGFGPGPLPMLGRLDLTDAQRDQVKSILSEKSGQSNRQALATLQRDLMTAIMADQPDLSKIEQLKSSISEAEAAALNDRVDVQLRIAQQVLTPEQRQKARELPAGRGARGE